MSTELLLPDKENSLKSALGMTEKSAIERFYENPCQYTFRKVLKQDQTPDMVRFAVENDGYSIRFIFSKLITYELCEIAVKQNSKALSYVPEKFKDQNLCELAVENDGLALNYVPGEWITPPLAFSMASAAYRPNSAPATGVSSSASFLMTDISSFCLSLVNVTLS